MFNHYSAEFRNIQNQGTLLQNFLRSMHLGRLFLLLPLLTAEALHGMPHGEVAGIMAWEPTAG